MSNSEQDGLLSGIALQMAQSDYWNAQAQGAQNTYSVSDALKNVYSDQFYGWDIAGQVGSSSTFQSALANQQASATQPGVYYYTYASHPDTIFTSPQTYEKLSGFSAWIPPEPTTFELGDVVQYHCLDQTYICEVTGWTEVHSLIRVSVLIPFERARQEFQVARHYLKKIEST